MTTVSISFKPEITVFLNVPRSLHLRYPLGNAFGMPGDVAQQTELLKVALRWAVEAPVPGRVYRLPYLWRRRWQANA